MDNKKPEPAEQPQGRFAEVIRKSKERRIQLQDKAAKKQQAEIDIPIPDDETDDD